MREQKVVFISRHKLSKGCKQIIALRRVHGKDIKITTHNKRWDKNDAYGLAKTVQKFFEENFFVYVVAPEEDILFFNHVFPEKTIGTIKCRNTKRSFDVKITWYTGKNVEVKYHQHWQKKGSKEFRNEQKLPAKKAA
ncbi:hypothetical protein KC842_00650 [Candidatus Nomurabacteria bacterium]|nr:hypothetical protein [Candidatus Nomurabacteria bacterium]USN94921.1 MAG: hypothetical protein H6791_00635 [Candidatus Nomurabacteria bacterium]